MNDLVFIISLSRAGFALQQIFTGKLRPDARIIIFRVGDILPAKPHERLIISHNEDKIPHY